MAGQRDGHRHLEHVFTPFEFMVSANRQVDVDDQQRHVLERSKGIQSGHSSAPSVPSETFINQVCGIFQCSWWWYSSYHHLRLVKFRPTNALPSRKISLNR